MATKTIVQKLENKHREWVEETTALFNKAIGFYFDILLDQKLLLELSTKEVLTQLERLSIKTIQNTDPAFPLSWELPAYFRRAAINTAIGAARSFDSNLERWHKEKEKGKEFSKRPPVPAREFAQHPLFY